MTEVGAQGPTALTNGTGATSTSSESDKENMPNTLSCDFDSLCKNFFDNVAPPGQVKAWDSSSASSSTRLYSLTENTPVPFTRSNSNPHVMTDNGKGMQQLNRLVKMMEQMCVLTEQNTKLRAEANYYSAMKDLERLRNENMNKKYCEKYDEDEYYHYPNRSEEVVSEPESIAGEDMNSAREFRNTKRKGRTAARAAGSKRSRSQGRILDDHGKTGILNFVSKITSKNKNKKDNKTEDGKLSKLKTKKDIYGNENLEDSGNASFDHSENSVYLKKGDNSDIEDVFDSEGFLNTKESDLSTASSTDELLESPGKSFLQRREPVTRGPRQKKGNLARQSCVLQDNEPRNDYYGGHKRALSFDAIEQNDREVNSQMRKSDTQPDMQAGVAQQEQSNKEKQRRFIDNKSMSSDMLVSNTLGSKSTSNDKRGKVTSGWDHIKHFILNKPPGQVEAQLEGSPREVPMGKSVTLATGTELTKDPNTEKQSNKKSKTRKHGKKNRNARNAKKDKTEPQSNQSDTGQKNIPDKDGQLDVGQEVDMSKFTPDFKLKYREWEEIKQKKKQLVRVQSDSQANQVRTRYPPQRSASTDLELVGQFNHASPIIPQDIVPIGQTPPAIQMSPDVVSNGRSSQNDLDHQAADSVSQNSIHSMNIASDSTSTSELKPDEVIEDGILPDLVDTAESHITKLEEMNLLLANELHYKTANLQQITEEIQKMQEEIAQLGTDIKNENRLSNASMGVALDQELSNIKSEVRQLEERFKPTDTKLVAVMEPTEDASKTEVKKAEDEKSLEESLKERETLVKILQSEIARQANEINYLRSHHRVSKRGKSFCGSERPGKTISKKRSNSERIRRIQDDGKPIMQLSDATVKEETSPTQVATSKEMVTTATQSDTTTVQPSDRPVSLISQGADHDGAISLTATCHSQYERPLSMISGCTFISERERPVSIASSLASSGSTRLEVVTSDSTPSLEKLHISAEDIRLSEILSASEEEKVEAKPPETSGKKDIIRPIPVTRQKEMKTCKQPQSSATPNTDISKQLQRQQSVKNNSGKEPVKEAKREFEEKKEAPPLSPSRLTKIEPQIELVKLAKSPQSQKVDIEETIVAKKDVVSLKKPEVPEKRLSLEKRESIKRLLRNNAERRKVQETFEQKIGERFNGKVVTRRATSDDIQNNPVCKDPMFSKRRDSFESLAKLSIDNTPSKTTSDKSSQLENQVQNLREKFLQNRLAKNIVETPQNVNSLKPRSYRTKRELPKEGCVKQLSQAFSMGSLDETRSTPQSLSPASSCSSIPVIGYSSTVSTHIRRLKSRTTDNPIEDGRLDRPISDPKPSEYTHVVQTTNSHRKSSPDLAIKNLERKPNEQENSKPTPSPKREKPAVARKRSPSSVTHNSEDRKSRRNGSVFTYTVSVDGSGDISPKDNLRSNPVSPDQTFSQTRLVNVKPVSQGEEIVTFTVNKRTGQAANTTENQNNNNSSPIKRSQRCSISDRKQLFESDSVINKPSTPRSIAFEINKLNSLALVGGKEDEEEDTKSPPVPSSPRVSTDKRESSGSEKSMALSEKVSTSSPKQILPKKAPIEEPEVVLKRETSKTGGQRTRQSKASLRENNNNQADLNTNNNNSKIVNENNIEPANEKQQKKSSKVERKESKTKHDVRNSSKETKTEKKSRGRTPVKVKREPSDVKSSKAKQNEEQKSSNNFTEGVPNKRWSFTGKNREDVKVDSKQTQNSEKGKKRSSSKQRSSGSTDSLFSKSRESRNSKERKGEADQRRKGSTDSKDSTTEGSEPQERRSRRDRPSARSRLRNKADRVPFLELMKRSPSVDGSNMSKDRYIKQRRPDLLERAQSVDRSITKREKSPSVERRGEKSRSSWISNFLRFSKN